VSADRPTKVILNTSTAVKKCRAQGRPWAFALVLAQAFDAPLQGRPPASADGRFETRASRAIALVPDRDRTTARSAREQLVFAGFAIGDEPSSTIRSQAEEPNRYTTRKDGATVSSSGHSRFNPNKDDRVCDLHVCNRPCCGRNEATHLIFLARPRMLRLNRKLP